MEMVACISKFIYSFLLDVRTHPNFNGGLDNSPLTLRHERVMTTGSCFWMKQFQHSVSALFNILKYKKTQLHGTYVNRTYTEMGLLPDT